MQTSTAPARADRLPVRSLRVLTEPALFVAGVLAYFLTRGVTEAGYPLAAAHADRLVSLERSLGMDVEAWFQGLVLPHHALVTVANWVYIYGHWPVIVGTAAWLAWRRPETYRWLRTAMLVSGAIGVVVFVGYPVAPPRLMPDLGIADTVTQHSSAYRVLQPPSFVNQYAALPSLHVGWDLLIGLALLRAGTNRAVKVLAVAAPVAMALAVVVTGNHYLVDVVAGVLVATLGALVATRWQSRRRAAAAVPEQALPEQARPEQQAGPEQAGPEQAGPEQARPEQAGPEQAGPEQALPEPAVEPDRELLPIR